MTCRNRVPTGWSPEHLAFLQEACIAVSIDLERRGRTGRAAFWENDRAELRDVLDRWVRYENDGWRGGRRARPPS